MQAPGWAESSNFEEIAIFEDVFAADDRSDMQ